jgi:hypothetical protein
MRRHYGNRALGHVYIYRDTWPGQETSLPEAQAPIANPPVVGAPATNSPGSAAPGAPSPIAIPSIKAQP